MPDTIGVTAEQLTEMIANLSTHIDEKAAEIAKPRIEAAFTAACVGIADTEREAIFEKQRLNDLAAELRRQVECQVRRAERAEAERDALKAAVERVRALHKRFREDIAVCDHCDEDFPCTTIRALAVPIPSEGEHAHV